MEPIAKRPVHSNILLYYDTSGNPETLAQTITEQFSTLAYAFRDGYETALLAAKEYCLKFRSLWILSKDNAGLEAQFKCPTSWADEKKAIAKLNKQLIARAGQVFDQLDRGKDWTDAQARLREWGSYTSIMSEKKMKELQHIALSQNPPKLFFSQRYSPEEGGIFGLAFEETSRINLDKVEVQAFEEPLNNIQAIAPNYIVAGSSNGDFAVIDFLTANSRCYVTEKNINPTIPFVWQNKQKILLGIISNGGLKIRTYELSDPDDLLKLTDLRLTVLDDRNACEPITSGCFYQLENNFYMALGSRAIRTYRYSFDQENRKNVWIPHNHFSLDNILCNIPTMTVIESSQLLLVGRPKSLHYLRQDNPDIRTKFAFKSTAITMSCAWSDFVLFCDKEHNVALCKWDKKSDNSDSLGMLSPLKGWPKKLNQCVGLALKNRAAIIASATELLFLDLRIGSPDDEIDIWTMPAPGNGTITGLTTTDDAIILNTTQLGTLIRVLYPAVKVEPADWTL